jgi:hypothetical protein
MGSAAMDKFGNLAVGYSVSSASVFPGIRYAGRLATDPLGELTQGEAELIAGSGVQTSTGSRWGDYSMMAVDPVDDCTFWYTTEYYQTTSSTGWQTRVGRFRFPNCVTTDFSISANPSTLTIPAGGSGATTVTVQSLNGFSALVNLSCAAAGFAVKCSFSPGGVTPPANGAATTTLTINTQPALRPGAHPVIVTAQSGVVTHTTTVTVIRNPN